MRCNKLFCYTFTALFTFVFIGFINVNAFTIVDFKATTKVIVSIKDDEGNELNGANLQIQDEEGKIVEYCKDKDGNEVKCEWISNSSPYEIESIPKGTYYLVETSAPDNYKVNEEKKQFIIDGEDEIDIEITNTLIKKDVLTLDGKQSLLIAVAMFDIGLLIGIFAYVKKNKA